MIDKIKAHKITATNPWVTKDTIFGYFSSFLERTAEADMDEKCWSVSKNKRKMKSYCPNDTFPSWYNERDVLKKILYYMNVGENEEITGEKWLRYMTMKNETTGKSNEDFIIKCGILSPQEFAAIVAYCKLHKNEPIASVYNWDLYPEVKQPNIK
jgi:hypothetical protein